MTRTLITIMLFLATMLAIAFVVIVPSLREVDKLNATIIALRRDLEQRYMQGQTLKELARKLEHAEGFKGSIEPLFVRDGHELALLEQIEEASRAHRLSGEAETFAVNGKPLSPSLRALAFDFRFQGSYENLLGLVKTLLATTPVIAVEGLELQSAALLDVSRPGLAAPLVTPSGTQPARAPLSMTASLKGKSFLRP